MQQTGKTDRSKIQGQEEPRKTETKGNKERRRDSGIVLGDRGMTSLYFLGNREGR
jgi:hypothetical protein